MGIHRVYICVYVVITISQVLGLQNEIQDVLKWPGKDSSFSSDEEEHTLKFSPQFAPLIKEPIQFRELTIRGTNEDPPNPKPTPPKPQVFFTSSQTKDHVAIHYPINPPENPKNRLPLDPEDAATLSSIIKGTTPAPENFFSGKGNVSYDEGEGIRSMEITLDILKHSKLGNENLVFSPLSIINILSLLLLGAGGHTHSELAEILHLKDPSHSENFHETFRKLRGYLSSRDLTLETASQVFADKHFHMNQNYARDAGKYYDAPVKSFNFENGKNFKDMLNQWVKEKTHGKIRSILDSPPAPGTSLALVDALYFKGSWEFPFPERITRILPFRVSPGEEVRVPMMTNVLQVPYLENEAYQMVALPYKGNQTGFFALLPKSNEKGGIQALQDLERRLWNLAPSDLENRVRQMTLQKVAVQLPRMKIQTDGNNLKEVLQSLGATSLFATGVANFTNISEDDGLFLSSIHHRAVIEINEVGTEAAAATLATGDRIIEDPPIPFIANRPFMFFIYNIRAQAVLFWGRVTKPQWENNN